MGQASGAAHGAPGRRIDRLTDSRRTTRSASPGREEDLVVRRYPRLWSKGTRRRGCRAGAYAPLARLACRATSRGTPFGRSTLTTSASRWAVADSVGTADGRGWLLVGWPCSSGSSRCPGSISPWIDDYGLLLGVPAVLFRAAVHAAGIVLLLPSSRASSTPSRPARRRAIVILDATPATEPARSATPGPGSMSASLMTSSGRQR